MIALFKRPYRSPQSPVPHAAFLKLLPRIRCYTRLAFRDRSPDAREELIQEAIANAYRAHHRLVKLGKQDLANATPLAEFAIKQVRTGRRVGQPVNRRDVMSEACRGVRVERLNRYNARLEDWKEAIVEDRRSGPTEIATARIDLAAWFRLLSRRNRRLARALGRGDSASDVAKAFRLSPGRVSQLRRWLQRHWQRFPSDDLTSRRASAA